jgi:hypothetical protein
MSKRKVAIVTAAKEADSEVDSAEEQEWQNRRKARAAARAAVAEAAALEAFEERQTRKQKMLHTVFITLFRNDDDDSDPFCYMLPIDEMPPLLFESLLMFGIETPNLEMETTSDFWKACYFMYREFQIRAMAVRFYETETELKALEDAYQRVTKLSWQVKDDCGNLSKFLKIFLQRYSVHGYGVISTDAKKILFPYYDAKKIVIDHIFMFDK